MDKEVVVHMHKGILLNCKKEHRWVSSNEVDEPRAYYRVKSEIEKWILYINIQWKEERGMIWVNSIETYTLPYVK